jgi:hypothetical protein
LVKQCDYYKAAPPNQEKKDVFECLQLGVLGYLAAPEVLTDQNQIEADNVAKAGECVSLG